MFDIKDGEELTKLIYDLSKKIKGNTQTVYQNLFTYHFRDSLGNGASTVLQTAYLKFRGFETEKAKTIFRMIAHIAELIITAIIGAIKTAGIPKITWQTAITFLFELGKFIGIKIKEHKIRKIEISYENYVSKIKETKLQIYGIYKLNYIVDFLILLAILLSILSLKFCKIEEHTEEKSFPFNYTQIETKKEIEQTKILHEKILPETKSFEFRADRRDFVDEKIANEWLNSIAETILSKLEDNTTAFLITGSVLDLITK